MSLGSSIHDVWNAVFTNSGSDAYGDLSGCIRVTPCSGFFPVSSSHSLPISITQCLSIRTCEYGALPISVHGTSAMCGPWLTAALPVSTGDTIAVSTESCWPISVCGGASLPISSSATISVDIAALTYNQGSLPVTLASIWPGNTLAVSTANCWPISVCGDGSLPVSTGDTIAVSATDLDINIPDTIGISASDTLGISTADCLPISVCGGGSLPVSTGDTLAFSTSDTLGISTADTFTVSGGSISAHIVYGSNVANVGDYGAVLIIGEAGHALHEGARWVVSEFDDSVADDGGLIFLVSCKTKNCHLEWYGAGGGDTVCFIYESPTLNTSGGSLTAYNKDRTSANTPETTMYSKPSVSVSGTLINSVYMPGGTGFYNSTGQIGGSNNEWIFAADTEYLIQLKNIAGTAQPLGLELEWHEED